MLNGENTMNYRCKLQRQRVVKKFTNSLWYSDTCAIHSHIRPIDFVHSAHMHSLPKPIRSFVQWMLNRMPQIANVHCKVDDCWNLPESVHRVDNECSLQRLRNRTTCHCEDVSAPDSNWIFFFRDVKMVCARIMCEWNNHFVQSLR